MTLQIGLLGPVTLAADGASVPLPPGKASALLALLALSLDRPVSVDQMVDSLWGTEPPTSVRNALHVYMSGLRSAIQRAGGSKSAIETAPAGYCLRGDDVEVDLVTFERLAGGGSRRSAADLCAALAMWRGPALAGLDAPFVPAARVDLEERRLTALEQYADVAVAGEDATAVAPMLRAAIADHPYREGLVVRLMRWQWVVGDQAGALRVCRELVDRLAEDLGVDPSPMVVEAQTAILRQQLPAGSAQFPRAAAPVSDRSTGLPSVATSFIGRAFEMAEMTDLLGRPGVRLVTVLGPGGVGKTRLALETCRHLADHGRVAHFVPLAAVNAPELVLDAVATEFGVRQEAGCTLAEAVSSAIGSDGAIVVLDNFEHLLAAAPDIADLVAHVPRLTVVTTSRSPLRAPGEWIYEVGPLRIDMGADGSPAVELLRERGEAVRASAVGVDDDALAAEVCRRLDGLPLAIELVAARLRLLTLRDLESLLHERPDVAVGESAAADSRQRSLRSCIDWSVSLLNAEERRFFSQLSVFAGAATIEQITAVVEPVADTALDPVEGLAVLLDNSLLRMSVDDLGHGRYRMLETIRSHAKRMLAAEIANRVAVEDRHAAHFLDVAEQVGRARRAGQTSDVYRTVDADIDELRLALRTLIERRSPDAMRLVYGLFHYWLMRGQAREGDLWCNAIMDAGIVGDDEVSCRFLAAAGEFPLVRGDMAAARALKERARYLAEQVGDESELAANMHDLAVIELREGRLETALDLMTACVARRKAAGAETWLVMHAVAGLATVKMRCGDFAGALELAEQTHAFGSELHDHEGIIDSLLTMAEIFCRTGRVDDAVSTTQAAIDEAREHGYDAQLADALDMLGCAQAVGGDFERAARTWGRSARLRDETGTSREGLNLYAEAVAATRSALLPEVFEATWLDGRSVGPDPLFDEPAEDRIAPVVSIDRRRHANR